MICTWVKLEGGGAAIVCHRGARRRRCVSCGQLAELVCDWKVAGKKSGTCDAPVCIACTVSPAIDKDLCPKHAEAWEVWKAERV